MKRYNNDSKLFAFLATFFTIIGFIVALLVKRDDRYVMYYAKQGLVLFIFQLIIAFITSIAFFGKIFSVPLWIVFFVVWIWSWVNALSGEMKHTPLISHFAEKIDL